jgi:acyl carrier protein
VTREEMLAELTQFVAEELLDGRGAGLEEHTPLLAWGIVDSLSVAQLVTFAGERFGIEVPQSEVRPANLENLGAYVDMLGRLAPEAASRAGG